MSEDLIKRKDAIKAIDDAFSSIPMEQTTEILKARRTIRTLPSADRPTRVYEYLRERIGDIVDSEAEFEAWFERMVWHVEECNRLADGLQGEWIDMGGYEVCKNCHEVKRFPHWNFCPNCGAKMKGVDDE